MFGQLMGRCVNSHAPNAMTQDGPLRPPPPPPPSTGGGEVVSSSRESVVLRILLLALGVIGSMLISRGLGPRGRGEYYTPVVAVRTLVALCRLGLDQGNVYLFSSRQIPAGRLSRQNGLVSLVAGGAGVLFLAFGRELVPTLFHDVSLVALVLAALSIPFALHMELSAGILTLLGKVTWQFRAGLVGAALQIILLGALFFTPYFEVWTVLLVMLVVTVATWLVTIAPLSQGPKRWVGWDGGLLKETLSQSLVLHVGVVLWVLHLRVDIFMLKAMTGTEAVGFYSLAVGLVETVNLAADSLALSILPKQAAGTLHESAVVGLRGVRMSLLLSGILALAWLLLGYPLITVLFGADFAPAYLPLVALLPGMVLLSVQRMCSAATLRTGRAGINTTIYAIAFASNAMLNLLLIPWLGTVGAALASTASYSLGALMFLVWQMKLAGSHDLRLALPGRVEVAMLWGAVGDTTQGVQRAWRRRGG